MVLVGLELYTIIVIFYKLLALHHKVVLDMAADRGAYIDQSQSLPLGFTFQIAIVVTYIARLCGVRTYKQLLWVMGVQSQLHTQARISFAVDMGFSKEQTP